MTEEDANVLRQVPFGDLPRDNDRHARRSQRGTGLSSTEQHQHGTRDRHRVADASAPAIEIGQVLRPMLDQELVVRRDHPSDRATGAALFYTSAQNRVPIAVVPEARMFPPVTKLKICAWSRDQ
jgi:hypothetical protein